MISKLWTRIKNFFKRGVDSVVGFFRDMWDRVKGFFERGVENIVGFFTGLPGKIKTAFVGVLDWLKEKITGVLDFLGLSGVGKRVSGIFSTIKGLVTAPLETIKGVINDYIIDTINDVLWWKVPVIRKRLGKILGLDSISYLQEGGIVTEPTVAALVEKGIPEAVLPLEKTNIQKFVTNLIPALAPEMRGPMEVKTDGTIESLLGQVVEKLTMIVGLLGREEPPRAPQLGGGF